MWRQHEYDTFGLVYPVTVATGTADRKIGLTTHRHDRADGSTCERYLLPDRSRPGGWNWHGGISRQK